MVTLPIKVPRAMLYMDSRCVSEHSAFITLFETGRVDLRDLSDSFQLGLPNASNLTGIEAFPGIILDQPNALEYLQNAKNIINVNDLVTNII